MITGTIVIEDHSIAFAYMMNGDNEGLVRLTVCDALTGFQKEVFTKPNHFAAALALAISPDEFGDEMVEGKRESVKCMVEQLFALGEETMAQLRLCDGAADFMKGHPSRAGDTTETAKNLLRFIP